MLRYLCLLTLGLLLSAQAPATYTNPVLTPVAADPDVLRAADGSFYLYGTQDDTAVGALPQNQPAFPE